VRTPSICTREGVGVAVGVGVGLVCGSTVGIGGSTYFTTVGSYGGGGGSVPECSASPAVTGGFPSKSAAELSARAEEVAITKTSAATVISRIRKEMVLPISSHTSRSHNSTSMHSVIASCEDQLA